MSGDADRGGGIAILVLILLVVLALIGGIVSLGMERDGLEQQVIEQQQWIIDLDGDRDGEAEDFRCEEDEDCWDCKTMGNQVCGPEVRHG